MQCQIQTLEENISKESNLSKQLQSDLVKLQQKCEDEMLKVSREQSKSASEEPSNSDVAEKDLPEILTEISSEDETKNAENAAMDESNEKVLQSEKSLNKTKDALIHTFIRYQDFCNTNLSSCDVKDPCGISTNNLKLLPPLKQPPRKYSQNIDSDLINQECLSSEAVVNLRNWQCGELAKDLQCKLKTDDYETKTDKPGNKIPVFREIVKRDKYKNVSELSKNNSLRIPWLDDW